jgi:hypothetical protein
LRRQVDLVLGPTAAAAVAARSNCCLFTRERAVGRVLIRMIIMLTFMRHHRVRVVIGVSINFGCLSRVYRSLGARRFGLLVLVLVAGLPVWAVNSAGADCVCLLRGGGAGGRWASLVFELFVACYRSRLKLALCVVGVCNSCLISSMCSGACGVLCCVLMFGAVSCCDVLCPSSKLALGCASRLVLSRARCCSASVAKQNELKRVECEFNRRWLLTKPILSIHCRRHRRSGPAQARILCARARPPARLCEPQ